MCVYVWVYVCMYVYLCVCVHVCSFALEYLCMCGICMEAEAENNFGGGRSLTDTYVVNSGQPSVYMCVYAFVGICTCV